MAKSKKTTSAFPKWYLNERTRGVILIEKQEDLDKWEGYPMSECDENGVVK
tara:strand:- start:142 stop:294 length:153 start_codon:yes stop_codon:yes gene_type:complete